MPRQNRVTPFGDLIATPDRGTFMGNRGVLHDARGGIKRTWQSKRWIICVLEFEGRKRPVMTPGRYTELFFLDEATALAAGHRPCAECRRGRFEDFRTAWRSAHSQAAGSPLTAVEIDERLHAERTSPDRSKRLYEASLEELPDGVLVRGAEWGAGAFLVLGGGLFAWSAGGYTRRLVRPKGAKVLVLTPESTVGAIRAGYAPVAHPSVAAL